MKKMIKANKKMRNKNDDYKLVKKNTISYIFKN